ncbi:MAG: hypothetical protein M1831_007171 [Alyxoria varia]|nr:MAG: hypothetical protein M1831_007171 [Alyxoria varia]
MPPTVVLIRHAEAGHNLDDKSILKVTMIKLRDRNHAFNLPDPELTYLGITQCGYLRSHLQQNLSIADQITLVVASPMRRTLQTASYGLSWLVKRGVRIIPRAEWQECSNKPSDTGSSVSALTKEFPDIDFSDIKSDPEWPSKTGRYAYSKSAVENRGKEARLWLRQRPEQVIAVVSHSAFLRTSVAQARFANADYRVFEFAEGPEDNPELVEWKDTKERGGAMGRSPRGPQGVEPGEFDENTPSTAAAATGS